MRTSILLSALALFGLLACNRGLKSQACVDYFAKNEACAAKAQPIKAEALRKTAEVSKQGFEKNSNPMAIEQSCKIMMQTLETDPDCK